MSLECVDHPWYTFKKPRINHWLQRSWREQDWRNKQSAQTNKLTNKLTNPKQNKKNKEKKTNKQHLKRYHKQASKHHANTFSILFWPCYEQLHLQLLRDCHPGCLRSVALHLRAIGAKAAHRAVCDAGHMGRWFSSNPWHWLVRHASIMYILYIHTVTVCNSNILSWSFLLVWIALLGGSQTHPLIMRRRRKRRRTCRR